MRPNNGNIRAGMLVVNKDVELSPRTKMNLIRSGPTLQVQQRHDQASP